MNGGLIGLNETKHYLKHHLRSIFLFYIWSYKYSHICPIYF